MFYFEEGILSVEFQVESMDLNLEDRDMTFLNVF